MAVAAGTAALVQCGGSSTSPSGTNNPPPPSASLQSVSLSASSTNAGSNVQGTVTLSSGAPSGGATVALSSSNSGVASVPGNVVVPQGSTSATFAVTVGSAGSTTITGTYSGVTQSATLSVNAVAPPVKADFTVVPDSNTTVSAGQCSASQVSGTSTQKLLCTFDASASTPNPGITEYRWALPGMTVTKSDPKLTDQPIPCGGFSSAGTQKDITLTVTAPGGSNAFTKSVTFVKGSPC